MKRSSFTVTAELLVSMFKKEIIYIENNTPLPADAELLSIEALKDGNMFRIYYKSEEVPEVVEGACVHNNSYHTFQTKMKSIFRRHVGKTHPDNTKP